MSNENGQPPPTSSSSSSTWSPPFISSIKEKFNSFSDEQRLERLKECGQIQSALNECKRVSALVEEKNKRGNNKSNSNNTSSNSNVSWRSKIWKKNPKKDDNNPSDDSTRSKTQGQEQDVEQKIRLQDSRIGMKIARFYNWGIVNMKAQAAISEMREKGNEWQSLRPPTSSSLSLSTSSASTNTAVNEDRKNEDKNISSVQVSSSSSSSLSSSPSASPSVPSNNKVPCASASCTMETHALWACRALALGCAPDLVSLKKCFENKLGTTNPSAIHYDSGSTTVTTSDCGLEQKKIRDCVLKNWNELKERTEKRTGG